jgi:hypothetical protein
MSSEPIAFLLVRLILHRGDVVSFGVFEADVTPNARDLTLGHRDLPTVLHDQLIGLSDRLDGNRAPEASHAFAAHRDVPFVQCTVDARVVVAPRDDAVKPAGPQPSKREPKTCS